jgi:hypothetical protein
MIEPPAPPKDEKDWTWVLEQPCPECGFVASAVARHQIPERVRECAGRLSERLARRDAATRPAPTLWSPLEYACHVRDVCQIFTERLELMCSHDDPTFANWDQDETARTDRYWEQDPGRVGAELHTAAERAAARFAAVREDEWQRPGRRSNGSRFSVDSLARYFLHDLVHHVHDVDAGPHSLSSSAE